VTEAVTYNNINSCIEAGNGNKPTNMIRSDSFFRYIYICFVFMSTGYFGY